MTRCALELDCNKFTTVIQPGVGILLLAESAHDRVSAGQHRVSAGQGTIGLLQSAIHHSLAG